MAGLGSIFVELDLDRTKFERGQYEILKNAQQTALSIEKNYKILGVKSDEIYQAMANGAINANARIANAAKASADEQFRAQSAMVAKTNALNMDMAKNPLFETLGIRSTAAIEAQKAAVIRSYDTIRTQGNVTARDLVNIEKAKNDKLKDLNREMVGNHEMSMAGMMRGVLRFYAAYYVASQAIDAIVAPMIKGFKAVEEYNTSIASMAAMVVTFQDRAKGMTMEDHWKNSLAYSQALIPVLEQIAAKTLLSGQETTALANAFARSGVFLNQNNAKQIESFTRISNALPLMTQGQEIMRQINTEIRGLMTGANEQSSMLLVTLRAIDPQIENHLRTWRAQGTVLENIGSLLSGFGPATAILENQWQAVKSTLDTTATQILRGLMKPAYEEIIERAKQLNDVLEKNKAGILEWGAAVAERMRMLKEIEKWAGLAGKMFLSSPIAAPADPFKKKQVPFGANELGPAGELAPSMDYTTLQEQANRQLAAMTKDSAAELAKIHKETMAEHQKRLNQQVAEFRKAGASETAISLYVAQEKALINEKYANDIKQAQEKAAKENQRVADLILKQWEENRKAVGDDIKKQYDETVKYMVDIKKLELEGNQAFLKGQEDRRLKRQQEEQDIEAEVNRRAAARKREEQDLTLGNQAMRASIPDKYGNTKTSEGLTSRYDQEVAAVNERIAQMEALYMQDTENYRLAQEKKQLLGETLAANQAVLQERYAQEIANTQLDIAQSFADLISTIGQDNAAAAIAALAITKGIAIAETIIWTQAAAARAMAELGPIAGTPMAASIEAMGAMRVGLIAATAVVQAVQVAGKRAEGGPVEAGKSYWVGEKGTPELFTPGASGMITPSERAGGVSLTQNITIDARGSERGVEQRIRAAMQQTKAETEAAIYHSMNRGGRFAVASGRRN